MTLTHIKSVHNGAWLQKQKKNRITDDEGNATRGGFSFISRRFMLNLTLICLIVSWLTFRDSPSSCKSASLLFIRIKHVVFTHAQA